MGIDEIGFAMLERTSFEVFDEGEVLIGIMAEFFARYNYSEAPSSNGSLMSRYQFIINDKESM